MLKGKDLISIHDLSVDEVYQILDFAAELKALQKAGVPHKLLEGKTLGMIFEKRAFLLKSGFFSSAVPDYFCRTAICNSDAANRLKIPQEFCRAISTES